MISGMQPLDWVAAGAAAVSLYVLLTWYLSPLPEPPATDAGE